MEFVQNWQEIAENIISVTRGAESDKEETRSYFRGLILRGTCFIASTRGNQAVFAPSRFIGYADNSMEEHELNQEKDGRDTNPVIEKILTTNWSANTELDRLYKNYCLMLGMKPRDEGTFGVARKYIDARDREIPWPDGSQGATGRNPKWHRDELILALDLYFRVNPVHTSEKHPEIEALSKLLNSLPIHKQAEKQGDFRNPNGVYMKLCNFLRFDPNYHGKGLQAGAKLEEEIWKEFADDRPKLHQVAQAIRENLPLLGLTSPEIEDDEEFPEGAILTRTHKMRERNPSITKKKKTQVLNQTGKLECEVCGFDFNEFYGPIGHGFAECHHNKPVSELKPGQNTRLSDLSIICANCHRIVHSSKPLRSIPELKHIVDQRIAKQETDKIG
jgi:5-methylcytosine-specific restriction enzyme A